VKIKMVETTVLVAMLRAHPGLRGSDRNPALIESIHRDGYLVTDDPVEVVGDCVTSGRCRVLAANVVGISWLPVRVMTIEEARTREEWRKAVAQRATGCCLPLPVPSVLDMLEELIGIASHCTREMSLDEIRDLERIEAACKKLREAT
jgi:hypothetical protein